MAEIINNAVITQGFLSALYNYKQNSTDVRNSRTGKIDLFNPRAEEHGGCF
jgi:hypothetical protein